MASDVFSMAQRRTRPKGHWGAPENDARGEKIIMHLMFFVGYGHFSMDLKELPFLKKLLFDFSIRTEFFP